SVTRPPPSYTLSLHDALPISQATAADAQWAGPVVLRGQIAYRRARLARDRGGMRQWIAAGLGFAEQGLKLAPNDPPALELRGTRSEEHTSELQSRSDLVCRLL